MSTEVPRASEHPPAPPGVDTEPGVIVFSDMAVLLG
jgi:hypothetical protein